MCFTNDAGRPSLMGRALSLIERVILYIFILATPLTIYPFEVDGRIIHQRKIREIALYSLGIIVCTFLQKSRWLRYFIIWCVVGWWLNYFWPQQVFVGLTNVFAALVLYIGLKFLLEKKFLNVEVLLRFICITCLFQFAWMIMQMFNYDPIFYKVTATGIQAEGRLRLSSWSGNQSVLGVFFACTSFLLLHYFKIKKRPILFFLIVIAALILKNATTAICFTVGGLFYLANRYRFQRKYIVVGIVVLLALSSFLIFVKAPNFDRLPIWKELISDGIKVRPFVGEGLNFFAELHIIDRLGTPWREAHNDYLQLILEVGIIGFIFFSGFIVSRFVVFFRERRSNKQICIASCLTAFLVSGVSLFPMHLAQISFYGIALLACLEHTYIKEEKCQSSKLEI
jgi:hypothetical protein